MALELAAAVAAYFLGAIPSAIIVARRFGHDVIREGSGNPGASNVYRVAGRRAAGLVFAADAGKGALAAGLGYAAGGATLAYVCGAAAVAGHVVPITRRFRGGKGVATYAGAAVVIEPLLALPAALVWVILAKLTHTASVASIVVAVVLATGVVVLRGPGVEAAVFGAMSALVLVRHTGNVRRLMHGEERTLR